MIFGISYNQKREVYKLACEYYKDKWVKRFAWFPTCMNTGETMWLGYYYQPIVAKYGGISTQIKLNIFCYTKPQGEVVDQPPITVRGLVKVLGIKL